MTGPVFPQTKCPRCFHPLPYDVYAWTLKSPETTGIDDTATAYTGHTVTMGEVHTERVPPNDPNWTLLPAGVDASDVDEVCPNCHYVLLPRWRAGHATCIAMAGARFTGKTVYIAVLIKQLQRLAEQYNEVVQPADQMTRERFRTHYEQPLYEEQGVASPTASATSFAHHPLIFNIGIWNGQTRYLVIRDVAGEDLENPQNVSGPVLEFFSRADSVFFLFDPLRVKEIAAELQDMIPIPELGGDPREVLDTVLSFVGDGTPSIAVILSKFDAFQKLAEVENGKWSSAMGNAGAAYNRDPGLIARQYDHVDGQLVDAEIRSLLQRLGAGPRLRNIRNNVTGQYYNHRFFVVSALGESPSGDKLHRNGISSFRCSDPVRWILAGSGALEEQTWGQVRQ